MDYPVIILRWILTCLFVCLSVFLRLVCLFCIINFTLPGSCDLRRPTIVVMLFVALYIARICRYSRDPPLACLSMFSESYCCIALPCYHSISLVHEPNVLFTAVLCVYSVNEFHSIAVLNQIICFREQYILLYFVRY